MTNYGKNDILGSATVLPATAGGLLLLSSAHPLIVAGLLIIMMLNLLVLIGLMSRFLSNTYKLNKYAGK